MSKDKVTTEAKPIKLTKVVNVSRVDQTIGKITIPPGRTAQIDVSENTVGCYLVEQGYLAVWNTEFEAVPKGQPLVQPKAGLYACPWCDFASNTADIGAGHIVMNHMKDILRAHADALEAQQ